MAVVLRTAKPFAVDRTSTKEIIALLRRLQAALDGDLHREAIPDLHRDCERTIIALQLRNS